MSCNNRIFSPPKDGKAITGIDSNIYYMATNQLYPVKTPYIAKSYDFKPKAQSESVENTEPVESEEPVESKVAENHSQVVSLRKVIPMNKDATSDSVVITRPEETIPAEAVNESSNNTAPLVAVGKVLLSDKTQAKNLSCLCPPAVVCPDIDYDWMHNNFLILITLLLVIIVLLWLNRQ